MNKHVEHCATPLLVIFLFEQIQRLCIYLSVTYLFYSQIFVFCWRSFLSRSCICYNLFCFEDFLSSQLVCCMRAPLSERSLPPVVISRSAGVAITSSSLPISPPCQPTPTPGYVGLCWLSAHLVSNWSGIRSFHFEPRFFVCFFLRKKKSGKKKICRTRYFGVLSWVESDVTSLNHVCPAIFKRNCTIITLTIFIYIYIISVVCYETVKLWLWDKNWRHVPFLSSITSCKQFTTDINI